jgi:predicted transporter
MSVAQVVQFPVKLVSFGVGISVLTAISLINAGMHVRRTMSSAGHQTR